MFTILLVSANTMAQAIRERTNELAVLKTLGFSDGRILWMVLLESCLIALVGGGLGLAVAYAYHHHVGDPTDGLLPAFYFPAPDADLGRHRAGGRAGLRVRARARAGRPAGCGSSTR